MHLNKASRFFVQAANGFVTNAMSPINDALSNRAGPDDHPALSLPPINIAVVISSTFVTFLRLVSDLIFLEQPVFNIKYYWELIVVKIKQRKRWGKCLNKSALFASQVLS